ncbi:hypothetical protein GCM10007170_40310 [Arthrobacter liuii]|uniref:Uncharacterized protein n=1 Tax=Arthrobacter liuii TaxID=1476996 RepID=A0ABQ2B0G6_9MICC|nr:hypothetical protein GCM10007170_40310 [Arthrobacter liuii]
MLRSRALVGEAWWEFYRLIGGAPADNVLCAQIEAVSVFTIRGACGGPYLTTKSCWLHSASTSACWTRSASIYRHDFPTDEGFDLVVEVAAESIDLLDSAAKISEHLVPR